MGLASAPASARRAASRAERPREAGSARASARVLGLEKFVELVNALSGVTIEIPDRHDFQDAIVLALSKYYRDVKHLNWKETRKQIEFDDFAPLRMGKKLSKLDRNIQKEIIEILKKEEEGQDNE